MLLVHDVARVQLCQKSAQHLLAEFAQVAESVLRFCVMCFFGSGTLTEWQADGHGPREVSSCYMDL